MKLGNIGLGVSVLVAAAACGSLLVAHAGPQRQPAGPAQISFAPKPQAKTFSATCNLESGEADTRAEPAWVGASYADDHCTAPALPARLDGFTASNKQVDAYLAAEKRYDSAAAAYQRCISHVVSDRSAEAAKERKSLEMGFVVIENHRIAASRDDEKKVSDQVTLAVEQFNLFGSECPD